MGHATVHTPPPDTGTWLRTAFRAARLERILALPRTNRARAAVPQTLDARLVGTP